MADHSTLETAGQLRITHEQPKPAGHWRTVSDGEISPPGGHYRLNLGGSAEVWVPVHVSRTANGGG